MHAIRATARYSRAIHATAELLGKLRIESMFVGGVARAAWLGGELSSGSVDVLALMNPPQKNQVAMMASHRGFRVDNEQIARSVELDLVPLNFSDEEGEVRVHVLVASNALYAHMMRAAQEATIDDRSVRIPRAEDLALMVLLADDDLTMQRLAMLPEFDRSAFEERLVSIGVVPR